MLYKNVRSMTNDIMNKLDIIISRPEFYTSNKQMFLSNTNQSHTHLCFSPIIPVPFLSLLSRLNQLMLYDPHPY